MFQENQEPERVPNWPGFYKKDNDTLLFAPNFVLNKTYRLKIEDKETYEYPVGGWSYFENEEKANDFFWIVE